MERWKRCDGELKGEGEYKTCNKCGVVWATTGMVNHYIQADNAPETPNQSETIIDLLREIRDELQGMREHGLSVYTTND